jgi:hypothetical protein
MPQITIDISENTLTMLKGTGLTPDEVFEKGMRQIREETPNELTAETIRNGRQGIDVLYAENVDDMFRILEDD